MKPWSGLNVFVFYTAESALNIDRGLRGLPPIMNSEIARESEGKNYLEICVFP